MKFMHLGDLHIGKSVNDFDMIDDQRFILKQIVQLSMERNVDGILIAGDVYDKSMPSERAVELFDEFLIQLASANKRVYIISGNHDSDERLKYGTQFFKECRIYICAKYEGGLFKITEEDEYGPLHIYMLPFVKAAKVRNLYPEEKIEDYDGAVRCAIAKGKMDTSERNILIAHQFVAGMGVEPVLSDSESATRYVGNIERVGVDAFDDFDYVALGHIHSPQKICREEVRYAGSPLKYSFSEVNHQKSVPIIEFREKGNINIELAKLKPLRDMRQIKGKFKSIMEAEDTQNAEDYIFVTLTDEEPVENAMSVIQTKYPNCMKITYENSHTKGLEQITKMAQVNEKPFQEILSEFYQQIYGAQMSEKELKFVMNLAGEVGIVNETNET